MSCSFGVSDVTTVALVLLSKNHRRNPFHTMEKLSHGLVVHALQPTRCQSASPPLSSHTSFRRRCMVHCRGGGQPVPAAPLQFARACLAAETSKYCQRHAIQGAEARSHRLLRLLHDLYFKDLVLQRSEVQRGRKCVTKNSTTSPSHSVQLLWSVARANVLQIQEDVLFLLQCLETPCARWFTISVRTIQFVAMPHQGCFPSRLAWDAPTFLWVSRCRSQCCSIVEDQCRLHQDSQWRAFL